MLGSSLLQTRTGGAKTLQDIIDRTCDISSRHLHPRHIDILHTKCLLTFLAIKMHMLVGNIMMPLPKTNLIFRRSTPIFDYVDHIFGCKQFKHPENTRLVHWIKQTLQIGETDRMSHLHQFLSHKNPVGCRFDISIYKEIRNSRIFIIHYFNRLSTHQAQKL